MKFTYVLGLLFLNVSFNAFAQQPAPSNVPPTKTSETTAPKADDSKSAAPTPSIYTRPNAKTRRNNYVKSIFGPSALARNVVGAGVATWRNSPEEWGGRWEGFGRRIASGLGKNAIKQTTIYGLDESFKLDSKFYRSRNRSFGAKIKNALVSPFTARKPNGRRVFGFPRVVGTYASSIVAYETWYPRRYDYKDGLRSGTISLGFNAAFNLFKEFIKK